jgi:CheY-like chemotaxis protein
VIGQTILVIDADFETEEKIVSTLEAEGYIVFAASGKEVITGTAGNIKPSLIFLKPSSNSVEGFDACKKIHVSDAFRDVPIIVLASLKGSLDPRYTKFYGIIDYLKLPVSPAELLDKTERVLGFEPRSGLSPEEKLAGYSEEEPVIEEKKPVIQEDSLSLVNEYGEPGVDDGEIGSPKKSYIINDRIYSNEQDTTEEFEGSGQAKWKFTGPVLILIAVAVIITSGFLAYRFFFLTAEPPSRSAREIPSGVRQQEPAEITAEGQQANPAEGEINPSEPADSPAERSPDPAWQVGGSIKPFYSVQLGAFKNKSRAEALARSYTAKGYEAFAHEGADADKGTFYRVLVGKFETRNEALQLSNRIHEKDKVKSIIFKEAGN